MDPRSAYADRFAARSAEMASLAARIDRTGQLRVLAFLGGVATALAAWISGAFPAWWAAAFGLVFVALVIRSKLLDDRKTRAMRAVRYYQQGLDRLDDRWAGRGPAGDTLAEPDHPYAADFDLFGEASLFQRLCTARTAEGQRVFASWLLAPAATGELRSRQAAVADLRERLDLREYLALTGGSLNEAADFAALAGWGREAPRAVPGWRRWAVELLGWFNLAAVLGWLAAGTSSLPVLVGLVLSLLTAWPFARWALTMAKPVEAALNDLPLLEAVLARLEAEAFAAPRLLELQASLTAEGVRASEQIRQLRSLADWYSARKNPLFIPIAVLMLWDVRFAFRFERWRSRSGPLIDRWLADVAELEALGSLGGYAFENPSDPFPEILDNDEPRFEALGLGHPLLPTAKCVRNDVRLGGDVRLLLVSGSNMSGKSTLLRSIGANAVLALAGGPVRAAKLALAPVSLGATIRVQDSLRDGRSRFFAEVTRVRAVLDRTGKRPEVLFLFDELFAGTNSADRLVGAEAVLRKLLDAGAVGLVTTHDLALTAAADRLGGAVNVHFADRLAADGTMTFDYTMRPGVVPHGNGIALMRAVGLDV